VLKYLARYTHRVAISNHRLRSLSDGRVRFQYKDYARGGQRRTMELTATEFLRRFLQHVLPTGFVRIRSYGFLANRHRREKLAVCRELLTAAAPPEAVSPGVPSPAASLGPGPGVTEARCSTLCPVCGVGLMVVSGNCPLRPRGFRGAGGDPWRMRPSTRREPPGGGSHRGDATTRPWWRWESPSQGRPSPRIGGLRRQRRSRAEVLAL